MRRFFISLLALVLWGCQASTPVKREPAAAAAVTALDANAHLQLGAAAYKRFETSYNRADLDAASEHYQAAWRLQPDNVNIQLASYNNLLMTTFFTGGALDSALQQRYQALDPVVQRQVASPLRPQYFKLRKTAATEEKAAFLRSAIEQTPYDAYLWYTLSTLMETQKNRWLAVATAERAYTLNPEDEDYAFQLADTINDVIHTNECVFDEPELSARALTYYSKAAALKKDEQLYLDNMALQYLRLGLLPLAYMNAKRAYQLEVNKWTAWHYLDAALLMGKLDEAETAAKKLLTELEQNYALVALAMIAAGRGQQTAMLDYSRQALSANDADFLDHLTYEIFAALARGDSRIASENLTPQNAVEQLYLDYFTNPAYGERVLVDNADGGKCVHAETQFFTALRYRLQGDSAKATEHLKLASQSGAVYQEETEWATVLLHSGWFGSNAGR